MKGLPRFPLFEWARHRPVFVIAQEVWFATLRSRDTQAFFEWGPRRLNLVRAQAIGDMFSDYLSQHAFELQCLQTRMLGRALAGSGLLNQLGEKVRHLETALFLTQRVLPRIGELCQDEPPAPALDAAAAAQLRRRLDELTGQFHGQSLPRLQLGDALPAAHAWGMANGQLYGLDPERGGSRPPRGRVALPGIEYRLKRQRRRVTAVAASFHKQLAETLLVLARERLPQLAAAADEARRLLRPYAALLRRLPADQDGRRFLYQRSPWRVYSRNGHWFVGLTVEPYALQDRDGCLYHFDGTALAARISPDGSYESPHLITQNYEHPFVPPGGANICLGDYQERGHRSSLMQLPPEERVLLALLDARQTLMGGWHVHNNLNPYRHPGGFTHRLITAAQAAERHLPVYPYWR